MIFMQRKLRSIYVTMQLLVSAKSVAESFQTGEEDCGSIYSRVGISLRNTRTDWLERYPRCLLEAPSLEKVDGTSLNITLTQLITQIPKNRSTEVKYMYVRGSRFTIVHTEAFGTLTNIKKLSLENNKIQTLEEKAFFYLQNIRIIDLSKNELIQINARVFVHLPRLEILFLYSNKLKFISSDAFVAVTSGSPGLTINLRNNSLNELPYKALHNTSVVNIRAQENNITEISDDILLIQSLKKLEVQNNSLRHVSSSLARIHGLSDVDLRFNKLTTVDKDIFQLLNRSLRENELKMSGNPWRCDCRLYWMIEFVQLHNVTDNIICHEPEQKSMLSFYLDISVCNNSQRIMATDRLQKPLVGVMITLCTLTTLGGSALCIICLWRKKFGSQRKHSKMVTNSNYYRPAGNRLHFHSHGTGLNYHPQGTRLYYHPQSVGDSSVISLSPRRHTCRNTVFKENSKNLGSGFTDRAAYGRLRLVKLLGRGAFGEVYEGIDTDVNKKGRKVAVKRLKDNASPEEMDTLMQECENLIKIGPHPNIIEVYGISIINGSRAIVMELAENGDLRDFVRKYYVSNRRTIINLDKSEEASYLMSQCPRLFLFMWHVAKGMEYLSSMKILHRDLATRNILIANGPIGKISDFGLSRDVYEAGYYYQESGGRLPFKWMSPESLISGKYTTKNDVWSFGILLWEVVTLGSSPFPGIPPDMLISMHNSGYVMPKPPLCPNYLYSIMVDCWKYAPDQRPEFATLVEDLDKIIQDGSKKSYIDLTVELTTRTCSVEEN